MKSGGRQRWLIEADTVQALMSTSNKIAGFPTGTYFEIRARGSNYVLLTYSFSNEDGVQIQLWPRPSDELELGTAVSIMRLYRVLAITYAKYILGLLHRQHWSTCP